MNTSSNRAQSGRRHFLAATTLALLTTFGLGALVRADDEAEKGPLPFKGTLYLIGGGANDSMQRFVDIAGGDKAVIAILPHASSVPQESADECANLFASRRAKNVVTIMPGQKSGLPKNVNAVFFTGGDQNRLMRLLDPVLAQEIQDFLKQGGLVGGTSAGAAAAPPCMIAGGMDDKIVKADSLLMNDGLGYLPGFVIDTHVLERARHDRLLVAVSNIDKVIGIGLDEDTAVEITGSKIKVWGKGHARFMQKSDKHSSTINKVGRGNKAKVVNMLYSVLSDGDEWEL